MNDPEKLPLQDLREWGYHGIADKIAEATKRWDDGLKKRCTAFPERYLNGWQEGLHVHVTVGVNGDSGISQKYCILYQLAGGAIVVRNANDIEILVDSDGDTCVPTVHRHGGANSKGPMLVDPVQFVNLPQGVRLVSVPSVVRLQRLDNVAGCRCDTSNLHSLDTRGNWFGMVDRKLGILNLPIGDPRRIGHSEGERQVIERGPKVENAITDKQAQSFWNRTDAGNTESATKSAEMADRVRRGLWVWFINDSVGLSFDPGFGLHVEALEMFASPSQLEFAAMDRTHSVSAH